MKIVLLFVSSLVIPPSLEVASFSIQCSLAIEMVVPEKPKIEKTATQTRILSAVKEEKPEKIDYVSSVKCVVESPRFRSDSSHLLKCASGHKGVTFIVKSGFSTIESRFFGFPNPKSPPKKPTSFDYTFSQKANSLSVRKSSGDCEIIFAERGILFVILTIFALVLA